MEGLARQPKFSDPVLMARKSQQCSQLYGFLATVYRKEPTTEFIRKIKSPVVSMALSEAGIELEADFFDRAEAELIFDLAVEYARLFVGPGKHIAPCESVHVPGGDQLWGEPAVAVQRFISQTGFEFKREYKDLPDHISVELEFMQQLSAAESKAWAAADREEAEKIRDIEVSFLKRHLSLWVSKFCNQVIANTQAGYFRGMATLTQDFIATDVTELEVTAEATFP
ncbi:MAG: molecular chaperone TorD family protein [Gammaproteobacteria bacterium]|nr:molecular chaperone TorD family protein [Gammaproteobacteria bacterium]